MHVPDPSEQRDLSLGRRCRCRGHRRNSELANRSLAWRSRSSRGPAWSAPVPSTARTPRARRTVPVASPVCPVSSVSDGSRAVISPAWICSRSRAASCRYGCCGGDASITVAELTMLSHGITMPGRRMPVLRSPQSLAVLVVPVTEQTLRGPVERRPPGLRSPEQYTGPSGERLGPPARRAVARLPGDRDRTGPQGSCRRHSAGQGTAATPSNRTHIRHLITARAGPPVTEGWRLPA
jgi:hypothetical protein